MIRIISALLLASAALTAPVKAQTPPSAQVSDKVQIADDAPDSYTVVKGDTLWGISGRFLKQPWRWPEVWRLNQEEIRNPHLIYPGQIIMLDRSGPYLSVGRPVGGNASSGTNGTVKLSPRVYETPIDSPIASVPMQAIQSFLEEPLVLDRPDSASDPTIVGIQEERVMAAVGDTVFAKNIPQSAGDNWQVYRRSTPIKEPVTGEILGHEAIYLGAARIVNPGDGNKATALAVVQSKQAMSVGDRMLPQERNEIPSYVPHSAPQGVDARVVSIYNGVGTAGRHSVISLSAGKQQGVEPGHVFALSRNRGEIAYRADGKTEQYNLPDERYGLVFVFRVFDRVSYALVLDASEPVRVADNLGAP